MGLIRAITGAIGGTLGDQWLDAIGMPEDMVKQDTLLVRGVPLRDDPRSQNKKGTEDIISNGSRIVVPTATCMLLVDGGRVVDFTTEPGYYTVDDSAQPSIFVGQWGDSLRQTWERFKFAGTTPQQQRALFIPQREIRDIKFGTKQPIQYFDTFYNAELFLRTFGSFTIVISNPLLFFGNVYNKVDTRVNFSDIQDQFVTEFMGKLTTAIAQLSAQGVRISQVQAYQDQLSMAMKQLLDADWLQIRGIEILEVGVESVSYTDESRELINLRNKGAMLSDPSIQQGFVAGTVAEALEAAGSNPSGGAASMMGIGFAGGAVGSMFGQPLVPVAGQPGAPAAGQPPLAPPPGTPLVPVAPAAPAAAAAAGAAAAAAPAAAAPAAPQAAPPAPPAAAAPADPAAAAAEGPKFCPNCGQPTNGARFCANCGYQLRP
ncbi:MAG: SPFH domain-containing protein [Bifidobacteriaceae bacterium]|jgi:membrane protease subunit (stomatin/prohibitin family)|nr:SPFH domain-containing protein [Bifidobacteriaceae bacterium]